MMLHQVEKKVNLFPIFFLCPIASRGQLLNYASHQNICWRLFQNSCLCPKQPPGSVHQPNPTKSNPIQSNLIQPSPTQSHPIQSNPTATRIFVGLLLPLFQNSCLCPKLTSLSLISFSITRQWILLFQIFIDAGPAPEEVI